MHLASRAYLLVFLTAVLAVAAIWSEDRAVAGLWHIPLALLLAGLALESYVTRRLPLTVRLRSAPQALLGVPQPAGDVALEREACEQ